MEELTKSTLAEGILMDILKTAETGTTVVQEVETKLIDLRNKAKPYTIVEDDEKEVPSSHRQEKEKEKKRQRQSGCQSSRRRTRKEKTPAI